jgi:hypothetical protein
VRCVRAVGCEEWLETNVVTITVGADAVAEIHGPDVICVGDPVTYSAYQNPAGASYIWDFGYYATPSVSTANMVTVSWSQAGVYNVVLVVENNGCVSTDILPIFVTDSPGMCNNLQNPNGNALQSVKKASKTTARLFPNPVSDDLNIQWEKALSIPVDIELISVDGRKLLETSAAEGDISHQAHLSSFRPGIYMLKLRYADGEMEVFRVVKQ